MNSSMHKDERKEPSVEKPPVCGPSPFNPNGTDPITLLTQKERTLKATREERGEEREGEREKGKKA